MNTSQQLQSLLGYDFNGSKLSFILSFDQIICNTTMIYSVANMNCRSSRCWLATNDDSRDRIEHVLLRVESVVADAILQLRVQVIVAKSI